MPIAILGPTASGKSSLAVAIAAHLGGTVVNGDPFQALQGLAIGTGQPSEAEQGGVPHVGYGVLPLTYRPNPASFGALVRGWLREVRSPVLVTGSGLYLRGIWDQLSHLPEVSEDLTQRVRAWAACVPTSVLHRYLQAVDPARAAALHPHDSSRVQRALALHLATGQPASAWLTGIQRGLPEGWRALLVLPERTNLRKRIAQRVRAMSAAGWRGEALAAPEADLLALRPLGYSHWREGRDEAGTLADITQATQAYAKRQTTFFQRQWPEVPCWDPDAESLQIALSKLGLA